MVSERLTRRRLFGLAGAAGVTGLAAGTAAGWSLEDDPLPETGSASDAPGAAERATPVKPGGLPHGVAEPVPAFGHVMAIDLAEHVRRSTRQSRSTAADLLRMVARLAHRAEPSVDAPVSLGIEPASLQVAVGVGASLLRWCGLESGRPASMVDVPSFATDRLRAELSGGDLVVHLAAEDPMRLAGAVQSVASALGDRAHVRWSRRGFRQTEAASDKADQTPRNLMGHRDGTNNPPLGSALWNSVVRTRASGPGAWMDGGSYLVVRDIRIDLDSWFTKGVHDRDAVIGRRTADGAPLGGRRENSPVDLSVRDDAGDLVVPAHAHIRVASSTNTAGSRIYRRSWNYDDGWTSAGERDAGLLFLAWQADPRRGFIPIQQSLVDNDDALNGVTRHVGSALFAMLPQPPDPDVAGRDLLGEDV
ncbi:MAG: Dyp-type peroxidase [Actinomycetia bacterium]|nr:Dyp-type peroxidase [Actinomycetes bacterium]